MPTDLNTRFLRANICGLKCNVLSVVTPRYFAESHNKLVCSYKSISVRNCLELDKYYLQKGEVDKR